MWRAEYDCRKSYKSHNGTGFSNYVELRRLVKKINTLKIKATIGSFTLVIIRKCTRQIEVKIHETIGNHFQNIQKQIKTCRKDVLKSLTYVPVS